MKKQPIAACMALAAFAAFAVMPAMASAAPTLTAPTGTLLGVGSSVAGTNVEDTLLTDASGNVLFRCNAATMTGTLTTNNSTSGFAWNVESLVFSGDATGGRCTSTFGEVQITTAIESGVPYCLKNTKTSDQLEIRGGKCSEASRAIKYIWDSTTLGSCTYQSSPGTLGTYTTHPSAARATITKQELKKISGSLLCPSAGFLDMTLNLTSGGNAIYVDSVNFD